MKISLRENVRNEIVTFMIIAGVIFPSSFEYYLIIDRSGPWWLHIVLIILSIVFIVILFKRALGHHVTLTPKWVRNRTLNKNKMS